MIHFMGYSHLLVSISGLLITSCFALLIVVRIDKLSDFGNLLIERALMVFIGILQLNLWAILLYGMDSALEKSYKVGWWPVLITILFWWLVLRPIKMKLYPSYKRNFKQWKE